MVKQIYKREEKINMQSNTATKYGPEPFNSNPFQRDDDQALYRQTQHHDLLERKSVSNSLPRQNAPDVRFAACCVV